MPHLKQNKHNASRKLIQISVLVVACCILLVVLWLNHGTSIHSQQNDPVQQPESDVVAQEPPTEAHESTSAGDDQSPRIPAVVAERVPDRFANYPGMNQMQRLNFVSDVMHDKHLDQQAVDFLLAELTNRDLMNVTRNNIANALVRQSKRDPRLVDAFAAMIADESEDMTWREYSMQFYAQMHTTAANPQEITDTLWSYATADDDSLAATALLHLTINQGDGVITELPRGWSTRVAELAMRKETPKRTRMTAVGVLGQHNMRFAANEVRELAATTDDHGLLRVSIAALGQIGNWQQDGQLIRAH
jgi:hypothetical protein